MILWARDALREIPNYRRSERKLSALRIALAKIEDMARYEDGQWHATFTKKALGSVGSEAVYWMKRGGALIYVCERGRNGAEYILASRYERDRDYAPCARCEMWVEKARIVTPDILGIWLRDSAAKAYTDDSLLVCTDCHSLGPVSDGCPGCGNPDTPCDVNGRPVCARCYVDSLSDVGLRSIVAGFSGEVDLSPYADDFVRAVS